MALPAFAAFYRNVCVELASDKRWDRSKYDTASLRDNNGWLISVIPRGAKVKEYVRNAQNTLPCATVSLFEITPNTFEATVHWGPTASSFRTGAFAYDDSTGNNTPLDERAYANAVAGIARSLLDEISRRQGTG
jgi:hypothetical protein